MMTLNYRSALIAILVFYYTSLASASCWTDSAYLTLQKELITKHFPTLAMNPPTLLACDQSEFAGNVLGDANSVENRIRILHKGSMPLALVLGHELGHILADKRGQMYDKWRGHGAIWLKTMIETGYKSEAERTANLSHIYPGLNVVFAEVLSSMKPRNRRPEYEFDMFAFLNGKNAVITWLQQPID